MAGYTKIDNGIFDSTLWWAADPDAFRIFFFMIAKATHKGIYEGTIPGIAGQCRLDVEKTRTIIAYLEAPEEDSRSKEFEGRRIEKIDGGWKILNYWKYRCKDYSSQRGKEYDLRHPGRRHKSKNSEQLQGGNEGQRQGNDLNLNLKLNMNSEDEEKRGEFPPTPPCPPACSEVSGPMPSPSGRREAAEIANSVKTPEPIQDCDKLIARLNVGHERVLGKPGALTLMDYRDQKRAMAVVEWAKKVDTDWLDCAAKAWAKYLHYCNNKGKPADFRWFAENPATYLVMDRSKND